MIHNVYISVRKRNTAGLKAPEDIALISKMNGFKRFDIPRFPENKSMVYNKFWLLTTMFSNGLRLFFRVKKNDVVIFQHPNYGLRPWMKWIPFIRKIKKVRFVVLIHDLESLRKGISGYYNSREAWNDMADTKFLDTFDYIISHNSHMSEYLIQTGRNPKKIVNLEIFDYLSDVERVQPDKSEVPSIAIAGNLVRGKCGYIYSMPDNKENLLIHLYGNNFDENDKKENMIYHGSFKPEELPKYLMGDFGLVWDGDSAEICGGNTGEYLRYNNPHKASLYLSSNMPVIVWDQSALSDFVLEHKVGITVSALDEIPDAIRNLDPKEYQDICKNVEKISRKLKSGYFFIKAVKKCK